MIHFLTLIVCILSVEIFVRSNFSHCTLSLLQVTRKVIKVLPQKHISDHWKEKAIPAYAAKMMQYSFRMLLILLSIIFVFFIANYIFDGFIDFSVSPRGIAEAVVFAFSYIKLRMFLF
jgi:hypothetical protein